MVFSSKSHLLLFCTIITICLSSNLSASQSQTKPRAFQIPITRDTNTLQHYATFQLGTPPTNIEAVIDLNGRFLSLTCDKHVSSTRRPTPCTSATCETLTNPKAPVCAKDKKTCAVKTSVFSGSLYDDLVTVHSTDGTAVYPDTFSARSPFVCVDSPTKGAKNVLGLGRTGSSFPSKLAGAYNIAPKFALCVPSSNEYGFGDLFIGGGGPYMFPGGNDASHWLSVTPLLKPESGEYLVGLKNLRIDKRINWSFDTSLDQMKISTATYHGVMISGIYKAIVEDFSKRAAARNITRVADVVPYGACYSTRHVRWTRGGPRVPVIDLELEGNAKSVTWRIHGANSMVRVSKDVMCLGFVDGGSNVENAIVLGGLQIEDNFLEFDLTTSRLGFSSSLLTKNATCSHFRNL